MRVTEVILIGCFMACVGADGVADVVLSCSLVEEGAGLGGMGGGALFTRTPATLVLRDVAVAPEESLETLTPFVPPSIPDPDAILFEAQVSSPEIPNADVLLHADCNEQEVMCEISSYSPRGAQDSSDPSYFMVSLDVEGVEFSTTLILQTLTVEKDQSTLMQNKLGLPLSQSGTLLSEVIFLVFSHMKSVSAPLRGDVLLNCGFKQQETPLSQEVGIEWRLQHRGKGRKVLEMKTRLDDAEGNAEGKCEEVTVAFYPWPLDLEMVSSGSEGDGTEEDGTLVSFSDIRRNSSTSTTIFGSVHSHKSNLAKWLLYALYVIDITQK